MATDKSIADAPVAGQDLSSLTPSGLEQFNFRLDLATARRVRVMAVCRAQRIGDLCRDAIVAHLDRLEGAHKP